MTAEAASADTARIEAEYGAAQEVSNLRLPVPFFDLLMVLLVTCLVFVAPLPPEGEPIHAMDIAIAQGKSAPSADALLAVIPKHTAQGWSFEVAGEGRVIAPQEVARRATAESRKVVLVVPPATELQDFVGMQAELAALNIPFALAIKSKEAP